MNLLELLHHDLVKILQRSEDSGCLAGHNSTQAMVGPFHDVPPSPSSTFHSSHQRPPKLLGLRANFVLQGLDEGLVQTLQLHLIQHQL